MSGAPPSPSSVAPAAAGGPTQASLTCPKCGTAAPAGARFCNVCGSSLTVQDGSSTGTAPAAGGPPVDLRQKVENDRGVLKRLQLLVPGFRGYRQAEDIREADSMLRLQVADKVKNARATLENSRAALTNAGQFAALTDLAPLLADLMTLEGRIRHAEQGYTGISPAVRANPQQLDRLYEYDYGFASAGDQLSQTVAQLPGLLASGGAGQVPAVIATARSQVNQLDQAFKARINVVEGTKIS